MIEGSELRSTSHFSPHLTETEILGGALEEGDGIEAVSRRAQLIQRSALDWGHQRTDEARQPVLFIRQRPPNDGLQDRIARRNDALVGEVLDEVTEDINGFTADPSGLTGACLQLLPLMCAAALVPEECRDEVVLFENGSLVERVELRSLRLREVASEDIVDIRFDLIEPKGEKELLGAELAKLENERGLGGHHAQKLQDLVLCWREGKGADALVSAEAGSPVHGREFGIVQNPQSFWCGAVPRTLHDVSFAPVSTQCPSTVAKGIPFATGGLTCLKLWTRMPVS